MSWLLGYQIAQWALRIVMVPVILRRRFSPAASLAWLSLIFFLPEVGLAVYLLVGGNRLGWRRARYYSRAASSESFAERAAIHRSHTIDPPAELLTHPVIQQVRSIGGMPLCGANAARLLADHDETVDQLVEEIDAAENHVHLVTYIFEPDATGRRVADALARAADRGVRCRVLADDVGSRALFRRRGLAERLNVQGVQVERVLPVAAFRSRLARLDLRMHRKMVVIDGRIGFAGSHNLIDDDYGSARAGLYVDLTGRFEGPIVEQLQVIFLADWAAATGEEVAGDDVLPAPHAAGEISAQAVATGPGHGAEAFPRVLVSALHSARRKVIMTTPYFVPDEPTMLALAMAVDRGVEVNLVIPWRSDHPLVDAAARSYMLPVLESGVRVYRHRHGMLHAKTMTVDDDFALLGSANLDIRSFYLNYETSVVLHGPQITRALRFAQTRYVSESSPVDLDGWLRRPAPKQYVERAAALLSPLL